MELIYRIIIIISAILGVFLAIYIARNKNRNKKLICPLGHNCDSVIHSRFSRFFGLRVDYIGVFYYFFIAIAYLSLFVFSVPKNIIFYILIFTSIAFVFILYLTFIQLIILKKWCTTCLGSFILSFIIIIASFLGFEASFGAYLYNMHDVLAWLFMISIFVGIISTSLYSRTFIKFLRDFKISRRESKRLSMFSQVALTAVGVTFFSGLSIVLTDVYGNFTESSKFIVIIIVLGVLMAYEIIVNMVIVPNLIDIHFDEHPKIESHHHSFLRKTAFSFILIGVVSWYVLLLLNSLSFYGYSALVLLLFYILLLIISVVIALYVEFIYYKKALLSHKSKFEKSNQL